MSEKPLDVGSPCPDGCTVGWPGRKEPERLRANEDGELSCPTCWEPFGFVPGVIHVITAHNSSGKES